MDAFNPPHDKASHHGETRLIRYAYGEGLEYVPFALRAGVLWQELAKKANKHIFHQTGILNIAEKDSSFANNVLASAKAVYMKLPLDKIAEGTSEDDNILYPDDLTEIE